MSAFVFRDPVLGFFSFLVLMSRSSMNRVGGSINLLYFQTHITLIIVKLHKSVGAQDQKLTLQFPVFHSLLFAENVD
jgi:hypothetical protein